MAGNDDMTLVLLHPFPLDGGFWAPMWRELDVPVHALTPDFPGFGQDTFVPDVVSIAAFADHVADLVRESGRRAVVCGLSLGGYVALALTARHSDCVLGLVLANTRGEADTEEARRNRDRAIDTIRIDGFDVWRNNFVPKLLRPEPTPQAMDQVWTMAAAQRPEAVIRALEALRDRPDRMTELGAIQVPTVVVAGAEDQITPAEAIQTLVDAIPGATKHVVADAGHLTAIEQPAAFASIVRELIDTVVTR